MKTALKTMINKDYDGQYFCTECNFQSKHYSSITRHIESKHLQTEGFQCGLCSQFCPTRNALTIHNSRYHKNN